MSMTYDLNDSEIFENDENTNENTGNETVDENVTESSNDDTPRVLGGNLGSGNPIRSLGLGSPNLTESNNASDTGRLGWDGTGKRFYENGVDHGILFVSNGDGTYGAGVPWNGLTTVTESPDGAEPNDLWADNMKYATLYSNETFGATIEAYTYPEEFAQCDGSYQVMPGVNFGQQDRKPFAFCYRTHVGNDASLSAYKLHIVYNCKASPSEKSYETINDSPDAITFSWEVSTIPVPHGNIRPVSSITIDESKLDERGLEIYKNIESMIYGDGSNPPTLPSIDQIAGMFGAYKGNPIVFEATKPTPVSELKVNVNLKQLGTGEPSLDNVREIVGYDSISVTRADENDSSDTYTITFPGTFTYVTSNDTNVDGPGIVYDGIFDLKTGEGVSYMKMDQMTSSELTSRLSQSSMIGYSSSAAALGNKPCVWVRNWNHTFMPDRISGGIRAACNAFPVSVHDYRLSSSQNRVYFVVDDSITSVDDFIAAVETLENNGSGLYIAYELRNPVELNLASQQIAMRSVAGTNTVTTESGNTIELVYREDVGAAASNGYTKQQLLNLSDPKYVQNLVRIGAANQVFDIGDQFNVTWSDGSNTYECPFDVVHFGKVIDKYGQEVNGMYLQSHWAIPGVQFDASEAIYYASEAMSAGTYHFKIGDTFYAFTTTQAIPQGGQIVIASSTSPYAWGGESSTYSSWKAYTYSSKESTSPLETLTISQGEPVGGSTNLGTITDATKYGDSGLNNLQRAYRGYNRWSQSALRQWLNSDAAAGLWWTAQNNYDRPPEQLSESRGFMAGLPNNFLNIVQPVRVTTALNTVTDSDISTSGMENTSDRFFLPSLEQNYIAAQAEGVEGGAFQYWKEELETTDPWPRGSSNVAEELIKYGISNHASGQNVRLRSVDRDNARSVFFVHSTGYADGENATSSLSVAPVCVIY